MKPIAVLSAGRSVLKTWTDDMASDYQQVFAINNAGRVYHSDWLCFLDKYPVTENEQYKPPLIGYLTSPYHDPKGLRHILSLHNGPKYLLNKVGLNLDNLSNCHFTFPAVLYELRKLAPNREVHIYGFDLNSKPDCVGSTWNHSPMRWYQELPWIVLAWPEKVKVMSDLPIEFYTLIKSPCKNNLFRLVEVLTENSRLIETKQITSK